MRLHSTLRSFGLALLLAPFPAMAHCDSLDGPVIKAARAAFTTGDVNHVLVWVHPKDEGEIRGAFRRAQEVRKLGPEAQKLADQYFFETLVRVHRAGEGAPFTGLKPAGEDFGPAIPAGDKALESGDLKPLWKLVNDNIHTTLHQRFEAAVKAKAYKPGDLKAGREYVSSYVGFIHYVEAVYGAGAASEHGEGHEGHSGHEGH
ncbi:MAG: DUF6448 family protein [Holophagaceae bacterium]|jgi:hypothetical protein|nr:DUF6448 family protein [Holophagaceae bacterium]